MNFILRFRPVSLFVPCALLALGCSGGGSGGGSEPIAGIDRGGVIAVGPITGFGSVIVNGVHYSTAGAAITVDGRPAAESDLRVGQVVRIEGSLDADGLTGSATRIDFNGLVEGPVQSLDLVANRLVVLGQAVQVSASTSFDDSIVPRALEGLAVGDRVEVSGLITSGGLIEATRIELKFGDTALEVEGVANGVDTATMQLNINELPVDYSTAQLEGFATGQPSNGDLLEVIGTLNNAGVFVASRMDRESFELSGEIDDQADLEGLITRFAAASDFDVSGQTVITTSSTRYEGGSATDLALDVKVEVEGRFDISGRIVAEQIRFRLESDVEISATVDSVDAAAGRLVVLGATVAVNDLTRFEDHSDSDLQRFGLADLRVGDYVEIRGRLEGSMVMATRLDRDEPDDRAELRGPVDGVAQPNLTIAGVTVTTDADTEFSNKNDESIDVSEFFAAADGQIVKVEGAVVGDVLLADVAELED
jgi:hypothetical protein